MVDAAKLALLAGVLVALYLLVRRLSERGDPLPSVSYDALEEQAFPAELLPPSPGVPLVGSEIDFPFDVRELEAKHGAEFFRPNILNYYFRDTDLVAGPPDPEAFYDELFLDLEHPETGHRWTATFNVATPQGLARVMAEDRTRYLFGEGTIIVDRFDLANILRAVMEHFAEPGDPQFKSDQIAGDGLDE